MSFLLQPRCQRVLLLGCLGCLYFLLCGCGGLKYTKRVQPPISVERVLAQLVEHRRGFEDLRARVSVSISREGKRQSFSANLLFDSSGRIRIEGVGFADIPYFFLAADPNRICLYEPAQQRLICGESSSQNLERLVGLELQPESAVAIFSGNLPASVSFPPLRGVFFRADQDGSVEFFSDSDQTWYRLWVDRQKGVMVRMETKSADKKPLLTVRFEDYQMVDGYYWPRQIECSLPSRVDLKIRYKQFSLNSGISDHAFHLPYPPGTVIENIGSLW